MARQKLQERFRHFAHWTSEVSGSPWAFLTAVAVIVAWAITGPIFKFSDTWQLVINTGTTIVTFLMVFLIQNTQNRDAKAIHLKLDELIRAVAGARNRLVDLESLSDEELTKLQRQFEGLRKHAQQMNVTLLEEELAQLTEEADEEVSAARGELTHAKGDMQRVRELLDRVRRRRRPPGNG
jgi:low affinity Fe/Cu permease